jgi:hypothetical protein
MIPTAKMLVEAVDTASAVAFKRSSRCPLMKYACKIYPPGDPQRIPAQNRVFCFYLWCLRRSILNGTKSLPFQRDIGEISDYRIDELCLQLAGGDQALARKIVDWHSDAFARFDRCDEAHAGSSRWVAVLSANVVRFILKDSPDPIIAREGCISSGLPMLVLIEIHNSVANTLNRLLGLNMKIRDITSDEAMPWDDIIDMGG